MIVPYEKDEYFPLDVTMFWEFFRWERFNIGHIYLQKFPGYKMYAGQSIQVVQRMRAYRNGYGSNPHHTAAIKKHKWENVFVLTIGCPWYMLDAVEIFLIAFYGLTDPKKGYNKQSGGRKNWTVSKETRAKQSAAMIGKTHTVETRAKQSASAMGRIVPMEVRAQIAATLSGRTLTEEHCANVSAAMTGRTLTEEHCANISKARTGMTFTEEHCANISAARTGTTQSAETCAKKSAAGKAAWERDPQRHIDASVRNSGENHWSHGVATEDHPNTGKTRTLEQRAKMSGENAHQAIPVCVFGKVYLSGKDASDKLRKDHAPNNKHNFISGKWLRTKKHQPYTFKVSKAFYAYVIENKLENITRKLYDIWSAFHFDQFDF